MNRVLKMICHVHSKKQIKHTSIQAWHRRQLQLQDCCDSLFKQDSHRDKGTLCNLKQYLNYTSVSSNMTKCFNSVSELLEVATESYVCLYSMKWLNIGDITDLPCEWPDNNPEVTRKLKKVSQELVQFIYKNPNIDEMKSVHIKERNIRDYPHCTCKLDIGGGMVYCDKTCPRGAWCHYECVDVQQDKLTEEKIYCSEEWKKGSVRKPRNKNAMDLIDHKLEYVQSLMMRGIRDKVRTDAVKWWCTDDHTLEVWHYFVLSKQSPKILYICRQTTSQCCWPMLCSPRLRFQIQNNRTVNIRGGKERNVEKDLHNEHLNIRYKGTI